MTDYSELVKALWETDSSDWKRLSLDAAAAIEELQNKVFELEEELNDADIAADDNGRQVEKLAKRNAELHAELERWVSAAEMAGEPKRGEWELIDEAEPMRWGCSRCKYLSWETSSYCPRCGAKMEVQDGE